MYTELSDALRKAGFKAQFGILYGVSSCEVVRVEGFEISRPEVDRSETHVHFARFCDGASELRWTPNKCALVNPGKYSRPNHYLLWGSGREHDGQWLRLEEGRIRGFKIPYLSTSDYIQLETLEVLEQDDYGNWSVADEILISFGGAKEIE